MSHSCVRSADKTSGRGTRLVDQRPCPWLCICPCCCSLDCGKHLWTFVMLMRGHVL